MMRLAIAMYSSEVWRTRRRPGMGGSQSGWCRRRPSLPDLNCFTATLGLVRAGDAQLGVAGLRRHRELDDLAVAHGHALGAAQEAIHDASHALAAHDEGAAVQVRAQI